MVDVKVEEVLWIVRLRAFVVSDCLMHNLHRIYTFGPCL